MDESEWLEKIASKSTNSWLAYGTDEDSYGTGIDPLISRRDMTSDPIKFYSNKIKIANEYWEKLLNNFEKDGER